MLDIPSKHREKNDLKRQTRLRWERLNKAPQNDEEKYIINKVQLTLNELF